MEKFPSLSFTSLLCLAALGPGAARTARWEATVPDPEIETFFQCYAKALSTGKLDHAHHVTIKGIAEDFQTMTGLIWLVYFLAGGTEGGQGRDRACVICARESTSPPSQLSSVCFHMWPFSPIMVLRYAWWAECRNICTRSIAT